MENEIMTVSDVAKYLQVSRSKVYELISKMEDPLPIITKIGVASPRFLKDQVDAWLSGVFEEEHRDREEDVKGGE